MSLNDLENQVYTFPKSESICSKSSRVRTKHEQITCPLGNLPHSRKAQ